MNELDALPLSPALARAAHELGYGTLTPIQARTLPLLLQGLDLVGQSRTGSGKTVAFSLPLLQRIRVDERALQALVLCPTRELSAQVARELRRLARHLPELRVVVLSGGQPLAGQARALEAGAHVAVGTPGRLIDHLSRATLEPVRVGYLVLDEADRMLEMGFGEDVERIVAALPKARQTVLFSATFPRAIEELGASLLRDPARVLLEDEARPAIHHVVFEAAQEDRPQLLLALLARYRPASALVFCNLKTTVVAVAQGLAEAGVAVAALHGDMEQVDRDRALARFRNGSLRVLVATDVAARGLDVEDLDLVVNVDLPGRPELYVHRVGRTGRAGKEGLATSFAAPREAEKLSWFAEETGLAFTCLPGSSLAPAEGPPLPPPAMATLLVFGGRKDKLRPGDLLGALTGEAGGLRADQVGRIELHDRVAFVAVAREIAVEALQALSAGRVKGRRFRVERVG